MNTLLRPAPQTGLESIRIQQRTRGWYALMEVKEPLSCDIVDVEASALYRRLLAKGYLNRGKPLDV